MRHKVLAEGTSQCALGLFLMTASACDSLEYAQQMMVSTLPHSSRDEQAACPLCIPLPHLLLLLLLQFTDMSPAAGLQA